MAQRITMQIGESRQLRGPTGEVEHWTTDNPQVVSVSDEDIVTGRSGGLLKALAVGTARITAVDFDGSRIFDVDVIVENYPSVTVVRDGTARLPDVEGVSDWTIDNSRVAEVSQNGEVHGICPGITEAIARGQDNSICAKYRVDVTGIMDVEINRTLSLTNFFSVPVNSWRCSSSAVSIDSKGLALTGDRPCTVEIFAELDDRSTFSFDLRVMRPQRTDSNSAPTPQSVSSERPLGYQSPADSTTDVESEHVSCVQRGEVLIHLERAEVAMQDQNWEFVNAELTAADLAATGYEDLQERVRRARKTLLDEIAKYATRAFNRASAELCRNQYTVVHDELNKFRFTPDLRPLADKLRALADLLQDAETRNDPMEDLKLRVHNCLKDTWSAGVGARQYGLLSRLGELSVNLADERMIRIIIEDMVGPTLSSCPLTVRRLLESSVAQTGELGIEIVLNKLLETADANHSYQWLLDLFVGLNPVRYRNVTIEFYRQLQNPEQELLVGRICGLRENSYGTLFDLMAAVLQRLPPDLQLTKAIQARIGKKQLENDAIKWASRGHKGAQIVLQRLYEYLPAVFRVP